MTNRTFLTRYSRGWRWDAIAEQTRKRYDANLNTEIPYTMTSIDWAFAWGTESAVLRVSLVDSRGASWQIISPRSTRSLFIALYGLDQDKTPTLTQVPWNLFGRSVKYRSHFNDHIGNVGPEWLEKPGDSYEIQVDLEAGATRLLDSVQRFQRAA